MIYISICAIVYSQRILVNMQVPSRPASQQQQQMAAFGVKCSLYHRENKAKANKGWRAARNCLFPLTSTSLQNSNNHFSDNKKQEPQFSFKSRNLGGCSSSLMVPDGLSALGHILRVKGAVS